MGSFIPEGAAVSAPSGRARPVGAPVSHPAPLEGRTDTSPRGGGVHKGGVDAPDCPEMARDPGDTADIPILASADALAAVPGYTLVRFLGEGALARAYECRAERTGDIVVVKVFTHEAAEDKGNVQRVLRESRVVAGLRHHPHIARVLDVGESEAGPYVVFERLPGTDLRSRLVKDGRMPIPDALAAVRDAARALDAAAAVGVAHRDVKPANLFLLEDGSVKLTDFGFAASLGRLGGPANVYGTPAFVAPELLRGAPADVRTDIYGLGATLFQLVTAQPLFEGATADVLAAHQRKPVPSIATLVPDAGIVVVDILYRLLQKDPARRPARASEVVTLLDEAVRRTSRGGSQPPTPASRAAVDPNAATLVNVGASGGASGGSSAGAGPGRPRQETATSTRPPSPFDASLEGQEVGDGAYVVGQPTGVMGTLKQMSVTEIIQMLEIGKKSARIDLQTTDGMKGTLHVHDGQVVHATANVEVGEPAVSTLCRKKDGFFRIHYEKEPCERNVHRPTQFVLLEAMRQIDEEKSGPASSDDAPTVAVFAPVIPRGAPSSAPVAAAAAVRRSVPLPALARPLDRAEGPADGIQLHDSTSEVPVHSVDDPTLPEVATGPALTRWRAGGRRSSALDDLRREAAIFAAAAGPALAEAARVVARESQRLAARADVALEPLRPQLHKLHPRVGELRPIVVVGAVVGAVLAVVLGLATAMGGGTRAEAATRDVLDGDAADVIEELEAVSAAERTLADDLALANAYAAVRDDERALELYGTVVPAGVTDPLALGFLLARLDASAPDDEMDLLVLWPDETVVDALAELTVDPRRFVRGNAVAVLTERAAIGRIDVEQSAILDLQDGTCGARRSALQILKVAGDSRPAVAAVARAARSNEGCFSAGELRAVAAAIEGRQTGE